MKEIKIKIPEYSENGIQFNWTNGFDIIVSEDKGAVTICANKEGLLSLANHMLNLAQEDVPVNSHIHLDEYNSLEDNSCELIIQKIK